MASDKTPNFLECGICKEKYCFEETKGKYNPPLFLDCHHSFCESCLKKLAVSCDVTNGENTGNECIKCPTCRKCTYLPQGGVAKLYKNYYVIDAFTYIEEIKVFTYYI